MATASLRRSLISEPPDGQLAHTPYTPSVNRFGSCQAHAAFAAPKSRIDRPILGRFMNGPGKADHLDILVGKLPESEPWRATLAPSHKYTPLCTEPIEPLGR